MHFLARGLGRFLLRFVLFFWICFTFPFPLDLIGLPLQLVEQKSQPALMQKAGEYYGVPFKWLYDIKNDACQLVGKHLLGVDVVIQPTGSGDTMRGYVGCLCAAGIALVAALLWSLVVLLVHRRKPGWQGDARLNDVVHVLIRFFLCEMLFSYGFAKVFPLQFAKPSSTRLNQPLGEMSPMGLLWTFMGFSTAYQMFTGAVEVSGGLLLTTRRTTLLGSLITVVAMTQIFALNMCFDVPVKLYSLAYLLMALFLLAPELPRLFSILVMGRAADARPFLPLLGSVRINQFALAFRTLLVLLMIWAQAKGSYTFWSDMHGGPPIPVTGGWEVISFQLDKKEVDKAEATRWKSLDFSNKAYMRLTATKPPNLPYKMTWNTDEKTLTLGKFSAPLWSAIFTYERPEPDKLVLQGTMDGKAIHAVLKPTPEKQYELMNRGFHWIQELPYNR